MMTDSEPIEIRKGNNHIRSTGSDNRYSAILFVVALLDVTPDEVVAARSSLGMETETTISEGDDE